MMNMTSHLASDEGEARFFTPPLGTLDDCPSPPVLRNADSFHVFVSYSSCDSRWTQSLITWLESPQCGLMTCHHERDFVPGCSILENMTNCIQKSQKVLLILSQDFVRSRWCLLEANMSMFRDCLERKPVVPVLLETDIAIPLHLCHITYLNVKDPEFHSKLLKVLCTPNDQLQGSSVVPYQPPSIYNGKALQPLPAVNEEGVEGGSGLWGVGLTKWGAGQFSESVPDQLRLVLHNDEKYSTAIQTVNSVSQRKVMSLPFLLLGYLLINLLNAMIVLLLVVMVNNSHLHIYTVLSIFGLPMLALWINQGLLFKEWQNYALCEMRKCTGQANVILAEEKLLLGCHSRTKLLTVYVCLDGCKRTFNETFQESVLAEEMFQRALLYFSSGYACCLANRHFPFDTTSSQGHLDGSVCFCQYVSQQLKNDKWSYDSNWY